MPRICPSLISSLFLSTNNLSWTASQKSRPHNRKRHHAEADFSRNNLPLLPLKKRISMRDHDSTSRFPPPAFWYSLSKVWLTSRVLRELDRRNQSDNSACAPEPAPQPVYLFSTFDPVSYCSTSDSVWRSDRSGGDFKSTIVFCVKIGEITDASIFLTEEWWLGISLQSVTIIRILVTYWSSKISVFSKQQTISSQNTDY